MTELTEQQKLERRRLKRQQRILQSAGDRLERITGTAFPERVSPSPSPSNSASSLRPLSSSSSSSLTNNTRTLRSAASVPFFQQEQYDSQQGEREDSNNRRSSSHSVHYYQTNKTGIETAEHFPTSNDPRRRTYDTYSKPVMEDIKTASSVPSILLEPSPSVTESLPTAFNADNVERVTGQSLSQQEEDSTAPSFLSSVAPPLSPRKQRPLSIMNTMLMRKLYRQHHHHSLDPSLKYWNVLHFSSMVWLTLCGLYTEYQHAGNLDAFAGLLLDPHQSMIHFPLFRNFVMMELLLFGAFRLYHPKDQYPEQEDDFTLIASQLPSPFDHIATVSLGYRRTLFCLVQDLSIIVFIIGFTQVIARVF